MSAIVSAALAILLATAPLGDGGRSADVLFLHQSLVAATLALVLLRRPDVILDRGRLLALLTAFVAFAVLTTSYRYSTLLVLADVVTAAAVAVLAGAVGARHWVIFAAIGLGAAINVAAGIGQALAGEPMRGLFTNAHHGACLVACATALLFAAPVASSRGRRLLALLGSVVGAGFVVALASRGATLALAAAAAVVLIATGRRRLLAALVAALVLALVLPTPLGRRVRAGLDADPFAYDRIQIWAASSRVARAELLRGGVGLGSFADAALAYKFPVERAIGRYAKNPNHAHSEYLQLLVEASVPGLLLLLWPVALAVRRAVAMIRKGGEAAVAAIACLAGVVVVSVHAGVEVVLHSPAVLYAFAALLGLLLTPTTDSERRLASGRVVARRGLPRVVPLLVALTAWVGGVLIPWLGDRAMRRPDGEPAHLERAMRLVPGHAGYRRAAALSAADAFRVSGRLDDLEASLWHGGWAVRLQPRSVHHRRWLATFQHEVFLGRWPRGELAARAIAAYDDALALDPTNALTHGARALLLASIGRLDDALAGAERAVALEPNYRSGHELRARIYAQRDRRPERAEALAEVARIERLARTTTVGSSYERALLAPSGLAP